MGCGLTRTPCRHGRRRAYARLGVDACTNVGFPKQAPGPADKAPPSFPRHGKHAFSPCIRHGSSHGSIPGVTVLDTVAPVLSCSSLYFADAVTPCCC